MSNTSAPGMVAKRLCEIGPDVLDSYPATVLKLGSFHVVAEVKNPRCDNNGLY